MLFQLVYNKRILGLASGAALGLFSLFMILAVLSEFRDFPAASLDGISFLLTGGGIFLTSGLAAGAMVLKHALRKSEPARFIALPS